MKHRKKTLCCSPIARYSLTKNWTLLLSQLGLLSLSQKEATTFLQQVFYNCLRKLEIFVANNHTDLQITEER